MIEVKIDSVRVSLMSQHRIVILKDAVNDRYLPIWIGPFEADAIAHELRAEPTQRPLTHDLIKNIITQLGGKVEHIIVSDLRKDIFYARIVISINGETVEIDARPSDAIAVAVRMKAPVFVNENVLDKAGIRPDEDIEAELLKEDIPEPESQDSSDTDMIEEGRLSAFADFVNSLDLDVDDEDDKD